MDEFYAEFMLISEAAALLEAGMFGGDVKRPEPVRAAKKFYPKASIGWGKHKEMAAALVNTAIMAGDLTVTVFAVSEPDQTKRPLPVPIELLGRLIRTRGGLPDYAIRPPVNLLRDGLATSELFAALSTSSLFLKRSELQTWYQKQKRRRRWPSQRGSKKPRTGRPSKQTDELLTSIRARPRDHSCSAIQYFRRRPEKHLPQIRYPGPTKRLLGQASRRQTYDESCAAAATSRDGRRGRYRWSGRNVHWSYRFTNEEILGPVPDPPSFPEDLAVVRDRVRKTIGKVSIPRAMTAHHPVIARLIAQDEIRRQKQAASSYSFTWDNPVFDSPFEQRRLRFLNALFLAMARCGGKAEVRGREAREMSITIHQTRVSVSLDRPTKGQGKITNQGADGPDQLRFVILSGYDREQAQASWQDGEGGRLEQFIQEIVLEVVTSAEISYREGCCRAFEWRVRRKAQLEEQARDLQLQMEREERERQQELEQARIGRLLDEAAALRRATDIRAYVEAVKTTVANDADLISLDSVERWSNWALAEADRIDPVKTARFLDEVEPQDDTK